MMQGEYKLFRQAGGRTAFAQVNVELRAWDGCGEQIIVGIDPADTGSATYERDPAWLDAAVRACSRCLRALKDEGVDTQIHRVTITRVGTNLVDTRPDAVAAAAFLATAEAFGARNRFRLVFQDEEWRVVSSRS